jgi:8-oxo-dGTP pyrophosphatase MutT (NUDIX family)
MGLWAVCGRLAFWASWPALAFYLRGSRRTRVLVVQGEKVLVTKAWLGDGRWLLPGGGLHRGEVALDGVRRELREETGLVLPPATFQYKGEFVFQSHGFRFNYRLFIALINNPGPLKKRPLEIAELAWLPPGRLNDRNAAPDVLQALRAWLG